MLESGSKERTEGGVKSEGEVEERKTGKCNREVACREGRRDTSTCSPLLSLTQHKHEVTSTLLTQPGAGQTPGTPLSPLNRSTTMSFTSLTLTGAVHHMKTFSLVQPWVFCVKTYAAPTATDISTECCRSPAVSPSQGLKPAVNRSSATFSCCMLPRWSVNTPVEVFPF